MVKGIEVIAIIVAIVICGLALVGGVMWLANRSDTHSVRRGDVKAAREEARRARQAIHEVRQLISETGIVTLDLVGQDLFNRVQSVIINYEAKELERNER